MFDTLQLPPDSLPLLTSLLHQQTRIADTLADMLKLMRSAHGFTPTESNEVPWVVEETDPVTVTPPEDPDEVDTWFSVATDAGSAAREREEAKRERAAAAKSR